MSVPLADVVNGLPKLETRFAWKVGIAHISEDQILGPDLWNANKAVAEVYELNADNFVHILDAFPGVARKRPGFMDFLHIRVAKWKRSA